MKKEKWMEVYSQEIHKYAVRGKKIMTVKSREDWENTRYSLTKLIKEVDALCEVYDMENKVKS